MSIITIIYLAIALLVFVSTLYNMIFKEERLVDQINAAYDFNSSAAADLPDQVRRVNENEEKTYLSAVAVLVCAALVGGIAGTSFYTKRHFKEDIVTGPNVTEVFKLSRYNPNLEGTIGDSDVYVLKGEKEGGSLVVLGSTHANEPSGHMAGIILEENAKVEAGNHLCDPEHQQFRFDPQ